MAKNVVIRRETAPNPPVLDPLTGERRQVIDPATGKPKSKGQGSMTAVSARTGWEYEHDETDEQIDALEELMASYRATPGQEKATFSWSSSTPDGEGDVLVGATFRRADDGGWQNDQWTISPDGTVKEGIDG